MEDAEYTTELEDVILDAAQVFQGVRDRIAAAGVVSIPMDARVAALLTHAEFISARRANPVAALLEDVDRETRRRLKE